MELKSETKYLLITAVARRGFRRCGYEFSRTKAELISVDDLLERDKTLKVKPGTTAKRLCGETKMLVVKQLTRKPGEKEIVDLVKDSDAEAHKGEKALARGNREKSQSVVAEQQKKRDEGVAPKKKSRSRRDDSE